MSERILVVDDDRATADLQAMLINTLGYEAKAVYSGQEAVELIMDSVDQRSGIGEGRTANPSG